MHHVKAPKRKKAASPLISSKEDAQVHYLQMFMPYIVSTMLHAKLTSLVLDWASPQDGLAVSEAKCQMMSGRQLRWQRSLNAGKPVLSVHKVCWSLRDEMRRTRLLQRRRSWKQLRRRSQRKRSHRVLQSQQASPHRLSSRNQP